MQTHQFLQLLKFGRQPLAILPAGLIQVDSCAARLWVLVRSSDHPDNGGTGCGRVQISLAEAAHWLQRSERSVRRYFKAAIKMGFFHKCQREADGKFTIVYASLRRLAKKFGLSSLGAIGEVPLADLPNARVWAAEIAAERLQAQSHHQKTKEWNLKGASKAAELLETAMSAQVSGEVVTVGHRLLYLAQDVRAFGASLKGIADRLGVSPRTAQYRLSNKWRHERGLPPILKRQAAYEIIDSCSKAEFKELLKCEEHPERLYRLGRRVFKVGTNLYASETLLRAARYRQAEYAEEVVVHKPQKSAAAQGTTGITRGGFLIDSNGSEYFSPWVTAENPQQATRL